MPNGTPDPVKLADYQPPRYLVSEVRLVFDLDADTTRVTTELDLRRNPRSTSPGDLHLDGVDLDLVELQLNGATLAPERYRQTASSLVVRNVGDEALLRTVTRVHPSANTALEGLYLSGERLCTQCEAEGFRKITYFPDRPDVMASYRVTLIADRRRFPVLLSNGNRVAQGDLEGGRHWVEWEDPFPKPCYLFALVAGRLDYVERSFTTGSGRRVGLRMWVEPKDLHKCDHALTALQNAMRWDEQRYGREYDLDLFNIVAIDDFNMGAMENKGLNLFNSSCVLASAETATDGAHQRIESIVAHEYFHNWSGNRVTCRDWFQLSLKEGFTVFRDQQFTADLHSPVVQRIDAVNHLRTAQFAEDSGPMSHPVRPTNYIEISNFYTTTIYEKGAEVVRMLHELLGPTEFRRGTDLYFERFDGCAVTTDDFVDCLQEVAGRDLNQFRRWYSQAGTPVLRVRDAHDATTGRYQLNVEQRLPDSPGQPAAHKSPQLIPLKVALLGPEGRPLPLQLVGEAPAGDPPVERVLWIEHSRQTFEFEGLQAAPQPSLLRGFSAPVRLDYDYSSDQLQWLARHETDGFNRWDMVQRLAVAAILEAATGGSGGAHFEFDPGLIKVWEALLADSEDPAATAAMVSLPSEAYLFQQVRPIRVEAIHAARGALTNWLALHCQVAWERAFHSNDCTASGYQATPSQMGRRALRNLALGYLCRIDPDWCRRAAALHRSADNLTDALAGLRAVAHSDHAEMEGDRAALLDAFYLRWHQEPLVLDQWFSVQASDPRPGALDRVQVLCGHPDFNRTNPNRVRALLGVFSQQNALGFHQVDGAGYRFLAEQVLALDAINPQMAARLVLPLSRWRDHPEGRAEQMRAALAGLLDNGSISNDLYEVVSKSLGDQAPGALL